ncbi:hypothetical protein QFW77_16955 [Luteimonas sp. RD2P54]|uniref:Uncharacterized protein n=1 Tax=Luteimonas endophytica TaxID=3042023 RepID=A0ABT6JDE9_9GAMM|nr:hypothetical protein [Luteimonas endophytica]MDH5824662.1 hypothetical protein [Luteimonas endophytica]
MGVLRTFALGAIGYFAYRAWQRRQTGAEPQSLQNDEGDRTPPHGDPVLAGAARGAPPEPRAASHSSRGFGEA